MAYLDILRFMLVALFSLMTKPKRLPMRSLRAEFFCRFIRQLLNASKHHSPEWTRAREDRLVFSAPVQREVSFEEQSIAGVPCLLCRPKSYPDTSRTVIYIHGGGYWMGSPKVYKNTLAQLALDSGANVVAIDYRLAPEHPFPAANDDCLSVSGEILKNTNGDVYLVGDSAGGALSVATALKLSEVETLPQLAGLVLISPWVEPTSNSDSIRINDATDIIDHAMLLDWIGNYMACGDFDNPRVEFKHVDLNALPSTYIQASGAEILIDQINDFANRARHQGVNLTLDVYEDQFHVFQRFAPILPGAREALGKIGAFIQQAK